MRARARRLAAIDARTLPVYPTTSTPDERLAFVARRASVSRAYVTRSLAVLPELRAWVIYGEVAA